MKTLFVLLLLFTSFPDCQAKSRPAKRQPGHLLVGIIQEVKPETQEMKVLRQDRRAIMALRWNTRTRETPQGRAFDSARLSVGTTVKLRYHAPLFDRPFIASIKFPAVHKPISSVKSRRLCAANWNERKPKTTTLTK